uniref:Polysulphide reductase, NrfD n=1 Tax=Solibacter usitatus (strain Ellin6076) TaxID=234267 RepID=Q022U1_SOLUE
MQAEVHDRKRYAETVNPTTTDGRDIDTSIGTLSGEAAEQEAKREAEQVEQISPKPWTRVPSVEQESPTYYDRPLLKESVWSVDIPLYYYAGGAAGAALALGAAVQASGGGRDLRGFAQQCHWMGVVGSSVGAAFLIHDLGRPERFLFMLRVFRPTSPMNLGAWILSGAAPTAIATALFINRRGLLGWLGESAGYASGVFGAALASYTGVLVANSAVPVWQEARRWMPPLFASSAIASAAAILDLFDNPRRAKSIVQVFGTVGRVGEVAVARMVESSASRIARVGEPLHRGASAKLWKVAKVLTAASLVVTFIPGKSRGKRRLAAVLATAGSLCLRFAVHYVTNASARDPRASFEQQRH